MTHTRYQRSHSGWTHLEWRVCRVFSHHQQINIAKCFQLKTATDVRIKMWAYYFHSCRRTHSTGFEKKTKNKCDKHDAFPLVTPKRLDASKKPEHFSCFKITGRIHRRFICFDFRNTCLNNSNHEMSDSNIMDITSQTILVIKSVTELPTPRHATMNVSQNCSEWDLFDSSVQRSHFNWLYVIEWNNVNRLGNILSLANEAEQYTLEKIPSTKWYNYK